MGMKRSCICDCWSEVQQECLYSGSGCFYDDERKKPEVTEEWIKEMGMRIACKHMISKVRARKIIRLLVKEIQGK